MTNVTGSGPVPLARTMAVVKHMDEHTRTDAFLRMSLVAIKTQSLRALSRCAFSTLENEGICATLLGASSY